MEWLAPVAGPPVFLVPPGSLDAEIVTLSGPEGHHAAAVRRLRPGERADVSDGAGTIAECAVQSVARDSVTLSVRSVRTVPAPEPRITVVQALPKGDRGELAVELMTEVGVDAIIPWAAQRCVVRWQGDRGERALAKWRDRGPRGRQAIPPRLAPRGPGPGLASRRREASVGRGMRGRPGSGRGVGSVASNPPGSGRDRAGGWPGRRHHPRRARRARRSGRRRGPAGPNGAPHVNRGRGSRRGPPHPHVPLVTADAGDFAHCPPL